MSAIQIAEQHLRRIEAERKARMDAAAAHLAERPWLVEDLRAWKEAFPEMKLRSVKVAADDFRVGVFVEWNNGELSQLWP